MCLSLKINGEEPYERWDTKVLIQALRTLLYFPLLVVYRGVFSIWKYNYMARFNKWSFIIAPNKDYIKWEKPIIQSVYFWLCDFAWVDMKCYPSYSTIGDLAGCSRRSCIDAIARLIEIGIVKKENRYNNNDQQSNNYYIIIKSEWDAPPSELYAPPSENDSPTPSEWDAHRTTPTSFNSPTEYIDIHPQKILDLVEQKDKEMATNFISYRTEPFINWKNKGKEKRLGEKTWSLERRRSTRKKNNETNFGRNIEKEPTTDYERWQLYLRLGQVEFRKKYWMEEATKRRLYTL